jgi:DNA-binding helix-hairpin-helix protein with protein kinase domain
LSSINTRRRALHQQEAEALRKIQSDIGAKVAALSRQIGALAQAEATDLANTLRVQQEQHITAHLQRFTVENASVSGVGSILKSRLRKAGFQTAADIDGYRVQSVEGIGSSRAAALGAWRASIESRARANMPQALSGATTVAIQAKYQARRLAFENERGREQRRQKDEENAVRSQCRPSLEQLDKEETAANTVSKGEIAEIRARYAQQYGAFRETLSKLADDTASKLREIDGRIGDARKELFCLHWEKEKTRRQLKAFERIRFPNYVKRLLLGSRAA